GVPRRPETDRLTIGRKEGIGYVAVRTRDWPSFHICHLPQEKLIVCDVDDFRTVRRDRQDRPSGSREGLVLRQPQCKSGDGFGWQLLEIPWGKGRDHSSNKCRDNDWDCALP